MRYENIRKLLKDRGLKQTDLATLLARDKSVITHLMQGKRKLSAEEAVKLAHFFHVEVSVILDESSLANDIAVSSKKHFIAESKRIPFQTAPCVNEKSEHLQKEGEKVYLRVEHVESGDVALEVPDNSMDLAGLLKGDIIVFSENAMANVGDIVVAQHYTQGGAKSVLRRYHPPVLQAESSDSNAEQHNLESDDIRVIAPVKRLIRLY